MTRWIGLAAVALALGAAWWWWRGRDAPRSDVATPADHSRAPADPTAPAPGPAAPPPPRPPAPVAGTVPVPTPVPDDPAAPRVDPAAAAASVPFADEPRDPAWAVDTERELKLRLDRLVADLAGRADVRVLAATCKRTLCRISVSAAAAADLSRLYGALETPEGLYGWADTLVLGDVTPDPATGALSTEILAQFER